MTPEQIQEFLRFQINEITEYHIYKRLAVLPKKEHNRQILTELSNDELAHYQLLKNYTGQSPQPNWVKIKLYVLICRFLGLTFGIKLMEKEEKLTKHIYKQHSHLNDLQRMAEDEEAHEARLIALIDEEGLNYMSSIVLGLNDALVEFTGALAGYTFALQNSKLVALTGAITGIAAALSMATSEYLSTRAEKDCDKNALKASIYTGIAYVITVSVLILPFVILSNVYWALGICLTGALVIIAIFNYYYAVVRSENFMHHFSKMAMISMGIATISFLIGYALRVFTGIEL